jgi:NAD(P)H-hydrate epimerase
MPSTNALPRALYTAQQVRALDRAAIERFGIPGATLMERAGEAAFHRLSQLWPGAGRLLVLCGAGNNGGDGYVVARRARESGMEVVAVQVGDPERMSGDAHAAREAYVTGGGSVSTDLRFPRQADGIVDGLFGTGLERPVEGAWAEVIRAANAHPAPVLSLDVPSGLHSDRGAVMGVAVEAVATISFIALKQGLFTGEGPACAGRIFFDALQVPASLYSREILSARRLDWDKQAILLGSRRRTAHKGHFGHVLVVGGERGFAGAARLAAEAAARVGAGLVSLATRPEHASNMIAGRPELMCHGAGSASDLDHLLERATVVAIGPGLGRSAWAGGLLEQVLQTGLPLVLDADALNLLASKPRQRDNWVLTPHPGEAARLLGCTASEIQSDRFSAAARLQRRWGGVVVLKGAGTLVHGAGNRPVAVCTEGNPGMASGGMGDVLTGTVAGLIAQGLALEDATETGVCVHGAAGDRAARDGERGLLAADLFPWLRRLVNPGAVVG